MEEQEDPIDVIWSEKIRRSSKIKPRLRAEWEVSSAELCILASCLIRCSAACYYASWTWD